ncbi:Maternal effect embryo arrest 40 [Heracleum sosnowskyi]|uniref:Maternal effect embryo arrest 40 n=1 Tax=Heracleum sosnowskyi TaxID=360622 RepID=A0AAD8JGB0_9APIA|nr:Maternal effect embryo arrest 40 [Heracleum sosnowskyi]
MALKLSPLRVSIKILRWVPLNINYSSLSCASELKILTEIDEKQLSSVDFDRFLKNKISPDGLIKVLDSTHDVNFSVKLFKWASVQKRFKHNVDTYFRIIFKLGMSGMIEEMEGFCKELVKEKCIGFEEGLLRLLDLFVEERRLDEALRVLGSLRFGCCNVSIGVFNALMGLLVEEKKDLKSVLFVYKEMVKAGIVPTVDTLNFLIEALFEANEMDIALNQYRRMRKKGCIPNSRTFEIVISSLIARNREEESMVVLREMSELGCEPDLKFYTHIIPIFCRLNELEVGMKLFKKMRTSNIVPDAFTYGLLIQCLCENVRVEDAIVLLDEMEHLNLLPPDHVFVNIVDGFCASRKLNEAKMFLQDGHILDTCSYNALLKGYCTAGDLCGAKNVFDRMVEMKIDDDESWNNLLRCLALSPGVDKSLEFLGRMIVSSIVPECATYSALVIAKCKANKLDDALKLFSQVCARSWFLDEISYAELVQCLCQRKKIQEAVEVFCYMSGKRCSLLMSSFSFLVEGLCTTGEVETAVRLLSLTNYSGTSCSSATYSSIMLGLFKCKKLDDLSIIVARMFVEGCPLDVEAYCILIESMIAVGRAKDCVVSLKLMLSEGLIPNQDTLANLISILAKQSQLHKILPIISKYIFKYEILSPAMYCTLINGIWNEGYKTEASHLLDIMLEKGWIPDASTHKLLISSSVPEEKDEKMSGCENVHVQDKPQRHFRVDVSQIMSRGTQFLWLCLPSLRGVYIRNSKRGKRSGNTSSNLSSLPTKEWSYTSPGSHAKNVPSIILANTFGGSKMLKWEAVEFLIEGEEEDIQCVRAYILVAGYTSRHTWDRWSKTLSS